MENSETQTQNTVAGQMESNPRSLHTPGPWTIGRYNTIYANGETLLLSGVALTCGNHPKQKEAEANARIVAAALEFYEAAKMLEDLTNNWPGDFRMEAREIAATLQAGSMIEKFKAAIAKVEGAPSVPVATDSSTTSY